jgi:hypothetical protein
LASFRLPSRQAWRKKAKEQGSGRRSCRRRNGCLSISCAGYGRIWLRQSRWLRRHTCVARLCRVGGLAAASGNLRLLTRRAWLRAVRFVTSTRRGANLAISDLRMLTLPYCSEIPTASPSTCNMRVRGEWQTRTAGLQSRVVPQLAAAPDPA